MKNTTQIKFDLAIFSLQAIKRAIHDANISQHATIAVSDDEKATIKISLDNVNEDSLELERKLNKMAFDNQIRIDTEKEFKNIRNIIVAQAFFPCENLSEILKDIDP